MSNSWFRMYGEFVNDPKVQSLSEALQRRYLMLLCIKSNGDLRAVTESNAEVALLVTATALRITVEDAEFTNIELVKFGLISPNWEIINWGKRQYISDIKDPTNTERQKRYKNKKRKQLGNGKVTVKKRPDTDTDTDLEVKRKSARAKKSKITLQELSVDHIASWLAKKRSEGKYLQHDENFILEYFKNYCESKGVNYENYVSAYRNAFEWDSCQPKGKPRIAAIAKPGKGAEASAFLDRTVAEIEAGTDFQNAGYQ